MLCYAEEQPIEHDTLYYYPVQCLRVCVCVSEKNIEKCFEQGR